MDCLLWVVDNFLSARTEGRACTTHQSPALKSQVEYTICPWPVIAHPQSVQDIIMIHVLVLIVKSRKFCVRSWAPQIYLHSLCAQLAFPDGGTPPRGEKGAHTGCEVDLGAHLLTKTFGI